jgi:hypothetical protein
MSMDLRVVAGSEGVCEWVRVTDHGCLRVVWRSVR